LRISCRELQVNDNSLYQIMFVNCQILISNSEKLVSRFK